MTTTPLPSEPTAHVVLNPATLGRPVHLLPAFCSHLREDLNECLTSSVNRRYGANFNVTQVTMEPLSKAAPVKRWLSFEVPGGRVGCQLDRSLALALLAYRYKLASRGAVPDTSGPVTSTEERGRDMFARQLVPVLAARLSAGLSQIDELEPESKPVPPRVLGQLMPGAGSWQVRATVLVADDFSTEATFLLDGELLAHLLRKLTPKREGAKSVAQAEGLANRLKLGVAARLLQRQITLGDLLELKPGDVIPIRLGATDLLIGESRLMTAAVAENKGKLCLTSFEDVE